MEDIFEIKFTYEQNVKKEVIDKFSTKQGGAFSVFSHLWECFAWAAIIGFKYDLRKPLGAPKADRSFSLNTMRNGDGHKIVEALICMCIAKAGSLDIMKDPQKAIDMINEYANGGFYRIIEMLRDEPLVNDLDWVKNEIFRRPLD